MNIYKNFFSLGLINFISRITGYMRDITIAFLFGTTVQSDIYAMAIRLPLILKEIFFGIAMNSSAVPLYDNFLKENKEFDFIKSISLFLLLLSFVFIVLFFIFTNPILETIAPKLMGSESDLTIMASRLTIFYILICVIVSIISILLQINFIFYPIGVVTIIFNLVLLICLYLSYQFNFLSIMHLSFAVILAGIMQIIYLIQFLKKLNLVIKKKFTFEKKFISSFINLFFPAIIIYGTFQIIKFASYMFSNKIIGHASYFYYADRLYEIPSNLISLSITIILLPLFSRLTNENNINQIISITQKSIKLLLIIVLPIVILMFFIPEFIVSLLFERGLFNYNSTKFTALILKTLSLSILPHCLILLLLILFFVQKYMRPLIYISLVIIFFHLLTLMYLHEKLFVLGPSLSIVLSCWLYLFILIWSLNKKMKIFSFNYCGTLIKYLIINIFLALYFYYLKDFILIEEKFTASLILLMSAIIYIFYLFIFDKVFVVDIVLKVFKKNLNT